MARVVAIGAGLGGLPAAYELRHHLGGKHRVTLVSEQAQFTFIPGLIQVALNLKPLSAVQLDLAPLCDRHGIEFVRGKVAQMDAAAQRITLSDGRMLDYDRAAIATGASLNFEAIPGLGPHGGYTHSVCTPEHAMEARAAWLEYLEDPGDLVVGAAPFAGCFGPAYEFLLIAEAELRRRGLRDRVRLTYITPEPYAGHLGLGGVRRARELTGGLLQQRGIHVIENAAIARVERNTVHLADGQAVPFRYAMILPSFLGAAFLRESGLGNAKGFVPVTATYRHRDYPSLYALGVAVQLDQPEKTVVPMGLPKSGEMTEAMACAVAHNIAVDLGAIAKPYQTPTLEALCFAEYGDTGIAYIAAPVVPDPATGKRRYSYAVRGRWVNWVKAAFEQYFMLKMQMGAGLPWFEALGLRLLFGLSLLKPLPLDRLTSER